MSFKHTICPFCKIGFCTKGEAELSEEKWLEQKCIYCSKMWSVRLYIKENKYIDGGKTGTL